MKTLLLFMICFVPARFCCQESIEGRWHLAGGASTCNLFESAPYINVRFISPRFKISGKDLSEEEEKHPERYKKARIMLELIYAHPMQVLCMSANMQYRLARYKRFSLGAYGGLKFFFISGPDLVIKPEYVQGTNRGVWFINPGLVAQFDLGMLSPFVDLSGDGVITLGTEFNFRAIYRNPKKRYNLHLKRD